jgi:cytochrome b561
MLSNTNNSYGWLSILLHWLSALAVIGLFAVGLWMVDLDYYNQWYQTAPHWHKSVGLCLAAITLIRLGWNLFQTKPAPLGKGFEIVIARIAHWVLYVLLFCIFVSGYLISTADGRGIQVFNWFTVPSFGELFAHQEDFAGRIHEWLAFGLIGLASIHALAALKHHFLYKNKGLRRMLSPLKEEN